MAFYLQSKTYHSWAVDWGQDLLAFSLGMTVRLTVGNVAISLWFLNLLDILVELKFLAA